MSVCVIHNKHRSLRSQTAGPRAWCPDCYDEYLAVQEPGSIALDFARGGILPNEACADEWYEQAVERALSAERAKVERLERQLADSEETRHLIAAAVAHGHLHADIPARRIRGRIEETLRRSTGGVTHERDTEVATCAVQSGLGPKTPR